MADVNVDAPAEQAPAMAPPTHTDEQILPRSRWVPITRVDNNKEFSSPPTPDVLIKFVNDMGYPKVVRTLSDVMTNDMFQPWRALTTIINLCLTGKTLGFERPRAPVLQIRWGVVHQADHPSPTKQAQISPETSDPDSPAPKPSKATKPKATKQSKPLAPKAAPVTKPAASKAPKTTASRPSKPTPATTEPSKKDQSKKARSSAPTEPSGHDESSSLYAELGLTNSETESDEEVPGIDAGDQDEGQAGPNPDIQDEGQAGSNPGDAVVSQPQSTHAVHTGPNREHMDFEENLKLPTEDQVRLEEPTSSTGTLCSLQNLDKELSFADQFLMEKLQEDELEKTNTESEVQSMVTVPIHQNTSSVPLMTTPVIDLIVSQPVSTTIQAPLPTSTATVITITTTTSLLPPP
ncbi:hypothetical protein Tco_0111609 [Tanacetum coccineum]